MNAKGGGKNANAADVRVARDGRGVVTLTLDAPDTRNALSAAMMDALRAAASDLAVSDARVVVLRGAGAMFCAGGDLNWMRAQADASPAERRAEAHRLAGMLGALDALPQAVVAAVQGGAFGGGVGLMCVADVAIAAGDARFGLTETRLGLIPATIGPYVVARIGPAAARRHMLSGARFGVDEAERIGLVARGVPAGDLDAAVAAEVAELLRAAPGAVAAAKAMARDLGGAPSAETVERTVDRLVERWESAEAAEGIAAFFGKRKPGWTLE